MFITAEPSARRKLVRESLQRPECLSPASVYDPLSATIAEKVGFEIGLLPGTVASLVELAAPDLNLITLTELAAAVRRIVRASKLALIVDADHGYGNALNTMRTVNELEQAGAAAIVIEDTDLPLRAPGQQPLVAVQEMVGKLRAAVAARKDSTLVLVGRTNAMRAGGLTEAVARASAYARTGVDALLVAHVATLADLEVLHAAAGLPLIVSYAPADITRAELAARGVRMLFPGHHALAAALQALEETYSSLNGGRSVGEGRAKQLANSDLERRISRVDEYRRLQQEFLMPDS